MVPALRKIKIVNAADRITSSNDLFVGFIQDSHIRETVYSLATASIPDIEKVQETLVYSLATASIPDVEK